MRGTDLQPSATVNSPEGQEKKLSIANTHPYGSHLPEAVSSTMRSCFCCWMAEGVVVDARGGVRDNEKEFIPKQL